LRPWRDVPITGTIQSGNSEISELIADVSPIQLFTSEFSFAFPRFFYYKATNSTGFLSKTVYLHQDKPKTIKHEKTFTFNHCRNGGVLRHGPDPSGKNFQ
jgi:hypothetical protein